MLITNLETWTMRNHHKQKYINIIELIRKSIVPQVWIGGGFLTRYINGEILEGDIDLYCDSHKTFMYTLDKLKTNNCIEPICNNANVRRLFYDNYPIHLIGLMYFDSARSIIESIDYTICQFVYDFDKLYCNDTSLHDLGQKRLIISNIGHGSSSSKVKRLLKYVRRGFTIDSNNLSYLLENLSCSSNSNEYTN